MFSRLFALINVQDRFGLVFRLSQFLEFSHSLVQFVLPFCDLCYVFSAF